MSPEAAALHAMAYYQQHRETIESVLDDMIAATAEQSAVMQQASPESAEAELFASIVTALVADPNRAATVAALAVMRLAQCPTAATLKNDRSAPTAPCGCMHYLGQRIVTCQGPHTAGTGDTLRWAD